MTICSSCRHTLIIRMRSAQSLRYVSTAPISSSPSNTPPPTSLTSGLSKSLSTFESDFSSAIKPPQSLKKPTQLLGSIPGGSELKGLGYFKAKPVILAKEDDQYPSWLWSLPDEKIAGPGEAKVDLNSMTKRQRAKHDRKQEKSRMNIPKEIPVHEQSKDLTQPGDSAFVSLERRQEITKSSRVARRKGIREDNFLRSM